MFFKDLKNNINEAAYVAIDADLSVFFLKFLEVLNKLNVSSTSLIILNE